MSAATEWKGLGEDTWVVSPVGTHHNPNSRETLLRNYLQQFFIWGRDLQLAFYSLPFFFSSLLDFCLTILAASWVSPLTQLFFFFFLSSASLPRLPMLEWLAALLMLDILSDECWRLIRRSGNDREKIVLKALNRWATLLCWSLYPNVLACIIFSLKL